jgi:hypothetical protein
MQISNEHQAAQVSGVSSKAFGFEMNAKMYDILISKMYTNKQGAVIRELSSNAWDAHKEAGMEDVPFDIQLPTWLDKSFYIRDYGTGIPHHRFENIYTNVGASTKEDSDDFIGGFGLGSKTPFTMTDTFMVENWNSGIKTTWICFKDKGEPQVSKVSEELSSEPSGLKVSFSFDEGDVPEFTKQVSKQLRYFPVKPNITGGEGNITFPELPKDWETKSYFYTATKDRYDTHDNYLVMGNVSYLLNSSEFDYDLRTLFSKGLTIRAPIGSVDVPPSREALEMTPKTKAYIISVLDRIKQEYHDDTQTKIDAALTEWELRKITHDINFSVLTKKDTLRWQGSPIDWVWYKRGYVERCEGYSLRTIQKRYKNPYRTGSIHLSSVIDGTAVFYVNDLGQGFAKHISKECLGLPTDHIGIFHVDGVTAKTKDSLIKDALRLLKAEIGTEPLLLSSLLGFPPVKVKGVSAPTRVTNQVFTLGNAIDSYSSLKSNMEEETTLPTNGYYIELQMWSLINTIPDIRTLLSLGLVSFLDKPLYAVRSKTIKKLDPSMVLLSVAKLQWLKAILVDAYKDETQKIAVMNSVHDIPPSHRTILSVIKDRKLKAYARYSIYLHSRPKVISSNTQDIHRLLFKSDIDFTAVVPSKITNLHAKYEPTHDVLCSVCNSWNSERNEKRIGAIVALINDNK